MATRNDVSTRALERIGAIRMGSDIPGNIHTSIDDALQDMLVEIHEEIGLDFDPLAIDEIPDERMPSLANLFRYHPHLDALDALMSPVDRAVLYELALSKFRASVIGESDFVEDEVQDF